jgi:cyclase
MAANQIQGGNKLREIAKNFFSEDRFSLPTGNPSYVVTKEGVVVVDTPELASDSVAMRDEIQRHGEVKYVINTHHHADHISGNYFFSGIVVAHEGVRKKFFVRLSEFTSLRTGKELEEMERDGNGILNHIRQIVRDEDPEGLRYMEDFRLKPPSITFSKDMTLYVGEYTFKLILLPGHTSSHIGVYIPEARIFFAGDNFTMETQPSLAQSSPLEWVDSLKKIESLDIAIVVPGHGKICSPEKLKEFRAFLEMCIEMVMQAFKKGISKEEASATISFEGLHPGKATAVHLGPEIQRKNVARIYETLIGR